LLSLVWGVPPKELQDTLDGLKTEGHIHSKGALYEIATPRRAGTHDHVMNPPDEKALNGASERTQEFISKLPIPHAHDFDWRFSVPGVRAFVEHLLRYHEPADSICVIAAPTVYAFLRHLDYFTHIALVERSENTVQVVQNAFGSISVCSWDLQRPWPPHFVSEFDCILMDPPWYQDYYELFILRAIEILAEGGLIHTALFPSFAKGHALAERSAIFSFAHNWGLYLVELRNGILQYASTPFEKKSRAHDQYSVPNDWRRGDIASFFLGHKYARKNVFQVETGRWKEFWIGASKVKLSTTELSEGEYEAPIIETVEDNSPYLADISRTYPPRQDITLWTSCQQAYKVKGTDVVAELLECIIEGKDLDAALKSVVDSFGMPLQKVREDCAAPFAILKEIVEREKEAQLGL
jgi:dGTPase